MANSSEDVDAALAGMAKVGAPRVPMGTSATEEAKFVSANTERQMLRPRGNTQAADPTAGEPPAHRTNVQLGADRLGAKYTVVTATIAPTAPEAGAVQASGRIIPPRTIRSRDSFQQGMETSYL